MEEEDQITFSIPQDVPEESIIKVIGVGGGGSNAVNHMAELGIHGVEFVVCNTDIQALRLSKVKNRIQLGKQLTEGRGAGCQPERGRDSALESEEVISSILSRNTRMIFITAGMGGGTGTGAAPEIARMARELDILTIGIVTLPFSFEGRRKVDQAWAGVMELKEYVDALLIIANDKLRDIYGNLKLSEAFAKADDVLAVAAKSIAEIITVKGYVNVDFADVESVMRNSGVALMGAAEAEGEDRDRIALENALVSPLLNCNDIRGASNVLLNILYGDKVVTMQEIQYITDTLNKKIGRSMNVIWGAGMDESLGDRLRVAVIATGFHGGMENVAGITAEAEGEEETSGGKPYFKVQEQAEDLQMELVQAEGDGERPGRGRQSDRLKRAPKRRTEMSGSDVRKNGPSGSSRGWLERKVEDLGDLFNGSDD